MDAILEMQAVSCGYEDGRDILKDISVSFGSGSRVALIGPNGSGKTTLVKTLLGLLKVRAGKVSVHGRGIRGYSFRELAKFMAYVPQPVDTGFSFTVEDFVMMGRYAYWSHSGAPDADDYKAVDRAMEITGTARFAKRNQNTLSGGERQKVMLAAAIAQDSEVLILDEPSAFLDPGHRAEIDNILFDINKSGGKTVVFATHDINRAALSSDRIIGLSSGKIVCDGTPREIMQPRVLGDLYGMDFIMIGHPADGMPMTLPSRPEINNGGMR